MEKNYDQGGQRVTSCCGCYSTYCDTTLCCKACYNEVDIGEGDGSEFRPEMTDADIDMYYKNCFAQEETWVERAIALKKMANS